MSNSKLKHQSIKNYSGFWHRSAGIVCVFLLLFIAVVSAEAELTILVGDSVVETNQDYNNAGMAEAFQFTALNSGAVNKIFVYIDGSSTATQVVMGLYADQNNNPGSLLAQGTLVNPVNGAWNSVTVPEVMVVQSNRYWIAILGPAGKGIVKFRDVGSGGPAQTSSQANLSILPATWSKGTNYANSPISAYAVNETSASTSTSTATVSFPSIPTPTPTKTSTSIPIFSVTPTSTPTSPASLTPTPTPAPSSTPTQEVMPSLTSTPLPTSGATPVPQISFSIGNGFSDVISHQIVRANNDRLYIFSSRPYTNVLLGYWTEQPGLPGSTGDFSIAAQVTTGSEPLSIDTIYDGAATIHVLAILRSGVVVDYPFDLATNTFASPITLATDSGTVTGDYLGTSGVSGMMDLSGWMHILYWSELNHIIHLAYTYNPIAHTFSQAEIPFQVDMDGRANHPVVAVSSLDNSITVAWVSEAGNPASILTRRRNNLGVWGSIESASTSPVWTSIYFGINIDQGPSLLISPDGVRHLAYIENYDTPGNNGYGHIHYVIHNGSGWIDQELNAYSNDPALAWNNAGELYMISHGHPLNPSCPSLDEMCIMKKSSNGTWGAPIQFASPPSQASFDSSPSVKWSVIGFNRPDVIEFLFFATPYQNPTLYYGRIATNLPALTPTSTATGLPAITSTLTGVPTLTSTLTSTSTGTPTPTRTATGIPTPMPTPTQTASETPTKTLGPSLTATVTSSSTPSSTATATGTVTPTATQAVTPTATQTASTSPTSTLTSTSNPPLIMIGTNNIGSSQSSIAGGRAKAFQYTADLSGQVSRLYIYIDSANNAKSVVVGMYTNTAANNPGTLISQGTILNPTSGAWNSVDIPAASLVAGTRYWIAILSPYRSGTLRFREVTSGGKSQLSSQNNLANLPTVWASGKNSYNSPLSAYGIQP